MIHFVPICASTNKYMADPNKGTTRIITVHTSLYAGFSVLLIMCTTRTRASTVMIPLNAYQISDSLVRPQKSRIICRSISAKIIMDLPKITWAMPSLPFSIVWLFSIFLRSSALSMRSMISTRFFKGRIFSSFVF